MTEDERKEREVLEDNMIKRMPTEQLYQMLERGIKDLEAQFRSWEDDYIKRLKINLPDNLIELLDNEDPDWRNFTRDHVDGIDYLSINHSNLEELYKEAANHLWYNMLAKAGRVVEDELKDYLAKRDQP